LRTAYPPKVFYTEEVLNDPLTKKRMDRILERVVCDRVEKLDDRGLRDLAEEIRLEEAGKRSGQIGRESDPNILFTTYKWPAASGSENRSVRIKPTKILYRVGYKFGRYIAKSDRFGGRLKQLFADLRRDGKEELPWHLRTMMGLRWYDLRDSEKIRKNRNIVCQSGYEVHSAYGCLQRCDYCFLGNTLMIGLNLEEMIAHLDRLIDENPWQGLYKFDNQTDNLCFEPEYGASELFVNFFAGKPGRYLMLYTKSDNVDHLLDLDHKGKTVVCWTLSADKVARIYEKGAPSMDARIEAGRKCQEAGYPVRFRLSPIIPVRNWEEENRRMLERLFSKVDPDIVCIEVLTHMSADQVRQSLDPSHLDPEILATMDEELPGNLGGPFPHQVREGIYRFFLEEAERISPETPVVTCLETPQMWQSLGQVGHMARMSPDDYICCCGPSSTPGNPLFSRARRGPP
jgi:spore photoproduct lyase